MSNRKILLRGAVAVALLAAAGLVLVAVGTAPGSRTEVPAASPAPGAGPAGPEAPPASVAAVAPRPAGALPAAATAPAPLPDIVPARPNRPASAAAHVEWDRVPTVARVGQLGRDVSGQVMRGLAAARAQMDGCFADEAQRLARGEGPPFDPADPPTGPATLVLLLESRPGGVDVVDTEVLSLGTSTAQLASCVQHVLKGWAIDAPAASGGRRYRLRYTVQ